MAYSIGEEASPAAPLSPPPRALLRAFLKSNYSGTLDDIEHE